MLAATVLWMLTLLCSLAAEVAAVACYAAARQWPGPPGEPRLPRMMAGTLLLAALVSGVVCLVLTPLVWKLRPVKPPLAIVIAAVLVGLAPIVTLVVVSWLAP